MQLQELFDNLAAMSRILCLGRAIARIVLAWKECPVEVTRMIKVK